MLRRILSWLAPRIERADPRNLIAQDAHAQPKAFKLKAHEIAPIAPGRGGCIASDRIVVDGCPVGYMYRGEPHNDLDSGWRFLAGDEDDVYMADNRHHDIYDINTIVNYDPDILPFLDAEEGSEFERSPEGILGPVRNN